MVKKIILILLFSLPLLAAVNPAQTLNQGFYMKAIRECENQNDVYTETCTHTVFNAIDGYLEEAFRMYNGLKVNEKNFPELREVVLWAYFLKVDLPFIDVALAKLAASVQFHPIDPEIAGKMGEKLKTFPEDIKQMKEAADQMRGKYGKAYAEQLKVRRDLENRLEEAEIAGDEKEAASITNKMRNQDPLFRHPTKSMLVTFKNGVTLPMESHDYSDNWIRFSLFGKKIVVTRHLVQKISYEAGKIPGFRVGESLEEEKWNYLETGRFEILFSGSYTKIYDVATPTLNVGIQGFFTPITHLGGALSILGKTNKVYSIPVGVTFGKYVYLDISGTVNINVTDNTDTGGKLETKVNLSGSATLKFNVADHIFFNVSYMPLLLEKRDAFADFIVPYGISFAF